jgi:hypothetical protein
MASTSNLLKQAETRRRKIKEQQDNIRSFEWSISAKTYDDYADYRNYLEDRSKGETDINRALSYERDIVGARRTYVSHEIQRQTIDVLEGDSTLQDKYNRVVDFYVFAVNNDDFDLAQSLRLQADNIDRSIQAQQERAQVLAEKMASEQVQTVGDYVDMVINGRDLPSGALSLRELNEGFKLGGDEYLNELGKSAAEALGVGTASYWDVYKGIVDDVLNTYLTASESLDPVNAAKLKKEYNDIINGDTTFQVPGLGRLNYQDINDAVDAQRAGQNLFVSVQRDGKNVFKKTNVTDYVWARDANGQFSLVRVRDEVADNFNAKSRVLKRDDKGNVVYKDGKPQYYSYKEALTRAGFDVIGSADGKLVIRATTASTALNIPGISGNQSFDVVIGEDGQVKLLATDDQGNQNIYGIDLSPDGTAKVGAINKEDISIFGDKYSAPTKEGVALTKQIIGQVDTRDRMDPNNPFRVLDQIDPYGRSISSTDYLFSQGQRVAELRQIPQLPSNDVDLGPVSKYGSAELQKRINTASTTLQAANLNPQGNIANPQQQTTPQLQAGASFNLNTTPVPANASLRVQKPVAQPVVTVSKPAPTPSLTVNKPKNTSIPLGVTQSKSQQIKL